MLNIAFKEWAAVCRALATSRQSIIIRKGGIAEQGGRFVPEHSRFWLYPTQFHQRQQDGLKPSAYDLLQPETEESPRRIKLAYTADVMNGVYIDTLEKAMALNDWHVWTHEMIEQRFHYRTPGFYLLTVRVYATEESTIIEETPAYAGCKSWVTLNKPLDDTPSSPVIPDSDWKHFQEQFDTVLTSVCIRK